ncbi:hypothetical protein FH505_14650 [Bacillus velezensis]|uniref:hypothetical protein n=1 Tax=Bacillus TaxID=1386 RepID=UPI00073AC1DA|nr:MULTISPECIES: hypothetical protein [Bacillus]ALV04464.1 hypothetical protein AVM03_15965 [Bacillus amyloliquefaciens]MBD0398650.1 hypothetical protein [Bacillus sp. 2211]NMV98823.1 hypothetical protein [Bacillus velezensis]PAE32446.1 hypothetical protein CHI00_15680 [Bacillus velezensis]TNU63784.1 hypothetical protein FH505_14650 [Bacillus velezensis]
MEDGEHDKRKTNVCSYSDEEKEKLLLLHKTDVLENISEFKEKYRKIVSAGIAQWIRDFQNGRIEVNTVDDLKKLIELNIQLQKDEEI